MSEYIKKDDILSAMVEVEYLGRRRMMVSASKIDELPATEVVRCKECKFSNTDDCQLHKWFVKPDDFCSFGEVRNE